MDNLQYEECFNEFLDKVFKKTLDRMKKDEVYAGYVINNLFGSFAQKV